MVSSMTDGTTAPALRVLVTDAPYCGVGGYFCVEISRPRNWTNISDSNATTPFPEEQPLIVAVLDTYENRQRFAIGKEWELRPKGGV